MTTDRFLPPSSIESEMAVLGSIFVDNSAIDKALGVLREDDFYKESHRKIFNVMMSLADRNEPMDFVTIVAELKKQSALEDVGGASYLLELTDFVFTSASIIHYGKIVAAKALDRRILAQAQETIAMIHSGQSSSEVLEKIESNLIRIVSPQRNEPVSAQTLVMESAKRLRNRVNNKGQLQGISWGIDGLDNATNGMHRGELIVIAGRPSMGKSAFVGNVLRSVCTNDLSSLLFSLEMSRVDVTDRFIADRGNIKFHHLRSGHLADVEWRNNTVTCEEIRNWKLFIDDTPGVTLREIKSKAKRQKRNGLDVLAVDYLQLMGVSTKENRVQSLGEISRGLKTLARELDIVVILLSQLNRSVDSRTDKRPLMSDLRDSGEIEQDADVILFPFRPAAYCQKCRDKVDDDSHSLREHQSEAEIIIEKQRNGERNISIPVAWFGQFQRFEHLT